MGGFLIFLAAAAAFVVGGAAVMLVAAFRRTNAHRAALLDAFARIEQLERALAALTFGEASAASPPRPAELQANLPPPDEPLPPPPPPPPPAPPSAPVTAAPQTVAPAEDAPKAAAERQPIRADLAAAAAGVVALGALASMRAGLAPGPAGLAIAVIAGAGLVAFAELRRRGRGARGPALVCLGAGIIFAAALLAVQDAAPRGAAPILLSGGAGLLLLLLSGAHGRWLAAPGLAAALAAPTFADLAAPSALIAPALALAAVGAGAHAAQRDNRPAWAWIGFAGGAGWACLWAVAATSPLWTQAAALFALSLAAIAGAYAWKEAATPLWPPPSIRNQPLVIFQVVAAAVATALTVLAANAGADGVSAAAGLGFLALVGAVAAPMRPGLAAAPLAGAAAAAVALIAWNAPAAPDVPLAAASIAGVAAAVSGVVLLGWRGDATGALMTAFAPLTTLAAAHARLRAEAAPESWAAGALLLAAALGAAYVGARRLKRRGAASVFVCGAALAIGLAAAFVTPPPWTLAVVALCVLATALADDAVNDAGLRGAALMLAAAVCAGAAASQGLSASPGARWAVFGAAWALIFLASRFYAFRFARSGAGDGLFALSFLAAAFAFSAETRRSFAALAPHTLTLAETALNVVLWLGLALLFAARFPLRGPIGPRALEVTLLAAAIAGALIGAGVLANPWWGVWAAAAPGPLLANPMTAATLLPAAGLALYALLRARTGRSLRAGFAIGASAALALLAVTIEVRRAFHGAAMAGDVVTPAEGWSYVMAWLGVSGLMGLGALWRPARWLRHVALAVALVAMAKAIAVDLMGARLSSDALRLALGAAIVAGGAAIVYRRAFNIAPDSQSVAHKPAADTGSTPS
jgi:hypothetical protein